MTKLDANRLEPGAAVHVVRPFMLTSRIPHAARDIVAKGTVETVLAEGTVNPGAIVRVRMAAGWDDCYPSDVYATDHEARTVARERLLNLAADLRRTAENLG